jgi:osmotically-inducible protein OsmY
VHWSIFHPLALALALAFSTGATANMPKKAEDSTITARVKAAMHDEPSLKSSGIIVETTNGRVQLSGFASSRADLAKALEVAQGVKGVRSVNDDMRLKARN